MLSSKLKRFAHRLDVDNNVLICLALFDLIIIMLLSARFVVPELFRPDHIIEAHNAILLYLRVVISLITPLLLGAAAVYFGVKSMNDMRKHKRGKVDLKDWKHWIFFVTVAFGVYAIVKTITLFVLFLTA